MFAQSEIGCDAIAGFYTLIATCVKYDLDPVAYLTDVLGRLSRHWATPNIDDLLPWNWKPAGDEKSMQATSRAPPAPKERVEKMTGAKVINLARLVRKADKIAAANG